MPNRISSTLLMLITCMSGAFAQTQPLASSGKEFWVGFMQNAYGAQSLRLNIAAPVGAAGTVTMPLTGWSTTFTVAANGQTTVVVPNNAENTGSESVTDKGVLVQSDNDIAVTAISYQSFTADGAQVLPTRSLGTRYRAQAYRGLPGFADFYKSELLIVATQPGTQVVITPSVLTSGGHPAGVPFTVNLSAGETYQVQSALASLDVTGTSVVATPQSGICRPFAVFSGSMCANVPVACPACDHIYEQMVPVDQWGTLFHTVPMNNIASYTCRVLAEQNGTQISIDGAPPVLLNAGQSHEVNGMTTSACITATLPVSVAEHMEGFNCAGQGDPSMLELLPDERTSTSAFWATVTSAQITAHAVSVALPTGNIGQLTIDGASVNPALFQAYTGCSGWSWAKVPVAVGTHRIAAAGGFIAYATGTGTGESYAFSIGNVAIPDDPPPTVICSDDPITLSASVPLINTEWTAASDPGNVITTGNSYTFTPTVNDTYFLDGITPISLCPMHYEWEVGVPIQPVLDITADGLPAGDVCQFGAVQLNAVPPPDPDVFDLAWTPVGQLSDGTIPDPIAYPTTDTWFKLMVTSPVGCGQVADSVFVNVEANDIHAVVASASDSSICAGDDTALLARVERIVASDNFETAPSTLWASLQGGGLSALCGSVSGTALRFDAAGTRAATTGPLGMTNGAALHFAVRIATGTAPCDDTEPGDNVLVQYSTDGVIWNTFLSLNEAAYPNWTLVDAPLPPGALTTATRFRWTQVSNSGAGTDNWALDNVRITRYDNAGLTFSWAPGTSLNNPSSPAPVASPTGNTTYTVTVQNNAGCSFSDQVAITVAPSFILSVSNNSTVCTPGTPTPLQATPSSGSGITYAWTPANSGLSSSSIANPVASPMATTTYSVTATNGIGCTDNAQVTITVGQLQSIDVTASDLHLCQGGQSQLGSTIAAGAPYTLAWTPDNASLSNTTAPAPTASPSATTTYMATVTETISGCSLSDAITIEVSPAYNVNAGPDQTICTTLGYQLNVVHNVPNPVIQWTNGPLLNDDDIQSPTIMFDTAATYQVTVTDAFGCSVSDQVTISDPFDLLITPINLDGCEGQMLTLDAQFPGCVYEWSSGQTTQTISVGTSDMYVCTITDPQYCQAIKTYFVDFHPLPVVDLGPDLSLCGVTSQTLDAGAPGSSYLWSNSATTQQITVSQSNTYSVTLTTPFNCSASDEVQVQFHPMPTDVLQDINSCISEPPLLNAGNAGATYSWNTGASSQSIVADSSMMYSVTITTPDECVATYDAQVTLMPLVVIDLGPDSVLCVGQTLTLDAGTPGINYTWTTGATTQSIVASATDNYGVSATNGYCSGSDAIGLTFQPAPVDVLTDRTACIDEPITLDAGNPGCTYLWSTNATTPQITVSAGGSYTVVITNAANCSSTFDATATFVNYPMVDLGQDTVLCEGDMLDLNAENTGASFVWSNGQQTQSVTVGSSGDYSVAVDNGYCVSSDTITAIFNPRPDRLGTHQFFTCLDEEPHYVVISGGNGSNDYDWSTGENTQVILAGAYGWYYVDITNQFDCTVRDSAVVNEFCQPSLYVPNTFTPNGDGTNDVWQVVGKNIGHFDLNVFDRGGQVIFHSDSPTNGWDGKVNGVEAPNEVYVWRMEYRFIEKVDGDQGVNHKQLGHVTILR